MRAGLAASLSTIQDVQVNAYAMAQPTPPGIQILPPAVTYDQAFHRGMDTWVFVVQGFVALTTDVGSQVLLDQMCAPSGSNSVKAALESNPTLSGDVFSVHVLAQSPGRVVDFANGTSPMMLVEWQVEVRASGG